MKKFAIVSLFLMIVGSLIGSRLLYLDSGIHFSEPDEWSYDIASKSLSSEIIPKVAGRPLLEQSPVFEYLAHWINLVIKDSEYPKTFLATRLVSVIASIILAIALFLYLKSKESLTVAFYALVLFTITPIILFYSKTGLREMLLILAIFIFYLSFERFVSTTQKLKWAILSGLALGMTVLVKTTALILFIIPIGCFLISFIESICLKSTCFNQFSVSLKSSLKWKTNSFYNFLVLLTSGAVVVISFTPYYFAYPQVFKDRVYLTFFSHNSEGALQKIRTAIYYLEHLDFWLSWPLLVLIILGALTIILKKKSSWFLSLIFIIVISLFLVGNEARGRYFVLLAPFLVIYGSLGLNSLNLWISRQIKFPSKYLFTMAIFTLIIPSTLISFESGRHDVFEQTAMYLRQNNHSEIIFSSFWPPIIQYSTGIPTARLTSKVPDLTRDYSDLPKFSPYTAEVAESYLTHNNTFIVIHSPIDKDEFSERKEAIDNIGYLSQPTITFSDRKPNFPEKITNFELKVYKFDKPEGSADNEKR